MFLLPSNEHVGGAAFDELLLLLLRMLLPTASLVPLLLLLLVTAGPPVREPRMDAETHKAVLAYCHKRRQEEKVTLNK